MEGDTTVSRGLAAADVVERELFYVSLNDDKKQTIILLHGLLASHLEWAMVIPHLSNYHILAVDLSGHSGSFDLLPATITASADRVAAVIRSHAHNGKAHVVGFSMSGFITCDLARRYPELVCSALITGAAPFQGQLKWVAGNPWVIWLMLNIVFRLLPDWLYWYISERKGLFRHEELLVEIRKNLRWEVIHDVYTSALGVTLELVKQIEVRMLTVAGGLDDGVQATKKMGQVLSAKGSRAAVVRKGGHTWDLMFPELFARGILAWVEERPLPEEFEYL